MTCIVAIVDGEKTIYMGGDGVTKTGNGLITRAHPKVYKRGEFVFGGAGYAVISQIMEHKTVIPPIYEGQDPYEYMINTFVPQLRTAIHETGQMVDVDGTEVMNTEILVGFRGHIYIIGTDFHVLESADNYVSIGSGSKVAYGSLHTTDSMNLLPEKRIYAALNAATTFCPYIGPPFELEFLEENKPKEEVSGGDKSIVDKVLDRANEMMKEDD